MKTGKNDRSRSFKKQIGETNLEKISKLRTTTTATESITASTIIEAFDHGPRRIIFIKTHKTGSSTIQNIFYRYALGTMKIISHGIPVGTD